jgi:transposase InsO family protein
MFVVADIGDIDVILGYPWLQSTDPIVQWSRRTFVFPYNPQEVKLCVTKKEIKKAAREAVYACVIERHPAGDPSDEPVKGLQAVPKQHELYASIFSTGNTTLPPVDGHVHAIELEGDAIPPVGPIYPLAETELEVLRAYIDEALANGRIRYSRSPTGAPVLFVPKKGGKLRLCVDYRALNKVTRKNRAPLPLINEILDRLAKAKRFTKLDLKDAYHRLRIREGDEWKTAFRCRYGHFEYTVMPFGLVNAPATFQTFINYVLGDLVDTICIVYLDDILIYSDNPADHTKHVHRVLERLKQHSLLVNLEKCEFDVERVGFLGFVVDPAGIHMEPSRVSAIREWPIPTCVKDVQVFLGFTGFYRRFVRNYSKVVAPLTDLLKTTGLPRAEFIGGRELEAISKLKVLFTRAPFLAHYDPNLQTRIESDASIFAIGAVLSQLKEGRWHPVAFLSRKLKGPELRYDTPDSELMAIVEAFRAWRPYVAYTQYPVKVLTDHLNHRYLATKQKLSGRQARWMEELSVFDFTIEYQEGKKNPADGLSRRPDLRDTGEVDEARRLPLANFLGRFHLSGPQNKANAPILGGPELAPWRGEAAVAVRLLRQQLSETVTVVPSGLQDRSGGSILGGPEGMPWKGGRRVAATLQCSDHPETVSVPGRVALGEMKQKVVHSDPASNFYSVPSNPPLSGSPPEDLPWYRRPDPHCRVGVRSRRPQEEAAAPAAEGTDREPASSSSEESDRGLPTDTPRSVTAPSQLLPPLSEAIQAAQQRDVFVTEEKWTNWRSRSDKAGSQWGYFESDPLLRFRGRVYIPPEPGLRTEILKLFHDEVTAGHQGVTKTFKRIASMFFWQSLSKDVRRYVTTCAICQRTKARHHLPYGELAALPVPDRPWKEISMDFIVKLPPSKGPSGKIYDSILVVVDRFTKYSLYIPTTEHVTSDGLASLLLHHVFSKFGIPDGIVSDRGSVFTSHFWASLCEQLAVSRRLSTAFHPQTDGQTERVNQSIEHYLRTYCGYAQDDWATKLYLAEFVFNTSWHSTIRETPAKALFGFDPRGPNDIPQVPPKIHVPTADVRVKELRDRREQIAGILEHAQRQYTKWYNRKRTKASFQVGSWVGISTRHLNTRRPCRKFTEKYLGPYQIVEQIGDHGLAYKLRLPPSVRIHPTFPISSLEPWRFRDGEVPVSPTDDPFQSNDTFEVEAILDHRGRGRNREYLVKWEGYDDTENSWVPRGDMGSGLLLREYDQSVTAAAR